MKLFDKLFGKNEKIRVQFIDCSTGNIIGVSNMSADQLPATFSVATTITISGFELQVEEAFPINAVDFIKTKNLTLKLNKIEKINASNLVFSIPTVSNEFPTMSETSLFNDFQILINDDDLRQNEFLNKSALSLIDIEVEKVRDIIENYSQPLGEDGMVFTKCHARDIIGVPNLNIDFAELKELLGVSDVGNLRIYGYTGFVLNAITLKTADTTFYGALNSETNAVAQLGISSFSENSINEIENIITKFELVFVNWCQCEIITGND